MAKNFAITWPKSSMHYSKLSTLQPHLTGLNATAKRKWQIRQFKNIWHPLWTQQHWTGPFTWPPWRSPIIPACTGRLKRRPFSSPTGWNQGTRRFPIPRYSGIMANHPQQNGTTHFNTVGSWRPVKTCTPPIKQSNTTTPRRSSTPLFKGKWSGSTKQITWAATESFLPTGQGRTLFYARSTTASLNYSSKTGDYAST